MHSKIRHVLTPVCLKYPEFAVLLYSSIPVSVFLALRRMPLSSQSTG